MQRKGKGKRGGSGWRGSGKASGGGDVWKGLERMDGGIVSLQAEGRAYRNVWRHHCAWRVLEKPGAQLGGLESGTGAEN